MKPARKGRKRLIANTPRAPKTTVCLTPALLRTARFLGDGCVSVGIRLALEQAKDNVK